MGSETEVSVGNIVRVNREGLASITGTVHAIKGKVVTIHEWSTGAMRSAHVSEVRVKPRRLVRGEKAGELSDWGKREQAAKRVRAEYARECAPRRRRQR